MVVGITTTYVISAYHHFMLWVRISIRASCTTLCDKVYQWLATGRWFSSDPPVSSTNKTNRHDITEILLKVALNTIKQTERKARYDLIVWSVKNEQNIKKSLKVRTNGVKRMVKIKYIRYNNNQIDESSKSNIIKLLKNRILFKYISEVNTYFLNIFIHSSL
jgi:hypothetical protein